MNFPPLLCYYKLISHSYFLHLERIMYGIYKKNDRRKGNRAPAGGLRADLRARHGRRRPPARDGGHLRLPAERGRQRKAARLSRRDGLRLHAGRVSGRRDRREHLRRARARRDARAGQRRRADPFEKGAAGADHRGLRLHGPAGAHGAEDQDVLSGGRPGIRPARAVALSGAARAGHGKAQARLRRRKERRRRGRGHPGAPRRQGQGLAFDHVRLQQLLHLLHRPLCPRARALASAGGCRSRGARACRGRI